MTKAPEVHTIDPDPNCPSCQALLRALQNRGHTVNEALKKIRQLTRENDELRSRLEK